MKNSHFSGSLRAARLFAMVTMIISIQGCALTNCDNYATYDDILDSWVGAELNEYERRHRGRPLQVMERPQNQLQYEFNTPYYNYDGSQYYCKTWLDVDRATGEIIGWRYKGDCYMHGRCSD